MRKIINWKVIRLGMLLVLVSCKAKECPAPSYNSVRWSDAEMRLHAFYTSEGEDRPKADRYYSWFDKGRIGRSQGGYSGKLLHGKYTAWYTASGQLKEQGYYDYGQKEGIWLLWEEDGRLKEQQKWRAGRLIGPREQVSLIKRLKKVWPVGFSKKKSVGAAQEAGTEQRKKKSKKEKPKSQPQ